MKCKKYNHFIYIEFNGDKLEFNGDKVVIFLCFLLFIFVTFCCLFRGLLRQSQGHILSVPHQPARLQ